MQQKQLMVLSGNTKYNLEFEIKSEAVQDVEDMYIINIIEKDSKNQETCENSITFGTYEGIKNIEVVTQKDTAEIKLEFRSKYKNIEKNLTIKSLKINNEEIPLKYKLLPTKFVEKIRNISFRYKTAQERFEMIEDALELSKENLLTGIGGNGWQHKYYEVQDYNYISRYLHSYPAKIILEFGIIGIIAYLGIIIILIQKIIKNKDIQTASILLALLTLVLHSLIDLEMEYVHILILFLGLIAVISKNTRTEEKEHKLNIILGLMFIIVMALSIYIISNIHEFSINRNISKLLKERNGLKLTSQEYLTINRKIANEYEEILKTERYNYITMYYDILSYYMDSNYEDLEGKLNEYYLKILKYDNKSKSRAENIAAKIQISNNIVQKLEAKNDSSYYEITEKFINIILDEYKTTRKELEICLKKQYMIDADTQLKSLDKIYKKAQIKGKRFLDGVKIYNVTDVDITANELEDVEVQINKDILIYHTHGTESFKSNDYYETYKFYRSTDQNYNVIKVGNYLEELLNEKGYNVIHEEGYYDLPTTSGAYDRSKEKALEILGQNENINLVIDVHRDAISEEEHIADTVEINGEKVARLRFVIGIDQDYEDWMYDLKLAVEIQKKADKLYPGLFKDILIRDVDYNQNISDYAILIEVGENCNMLEEALNATKYFAELVSEY